MNERFHWVWHCMEICWVLVSHASKFIVHMHDAYQFSVATSTFYCQPILAGLDSEVGVTNKHSYLSTCLKHKAFVCNIDVLTENRDILRNDT